MTFNTRANQQFALQIPNQRITKNRAGSTNVARFRHNLNMPQLNEGVVLDALRQIKDPDLHKDIVALGFIKDLKIDGADVSFRIVLTTPACPVKAEMESAAREFVGSLSGVTSVNVTMDAEVPKDVVSVRKS